MLLCRSENETLQEVPTKVDVKNKSLSSHSLFSLFSFSCEYFCCQCFLGANIQSYLPTQVQRTMSSVWQHSPFLFLDLENEKSYYPGSQITDVEGLAAIEIYLTITDFTLVLDRFLTQKCCSFHQVEAISSFGPLDRCYILWNHTLGENNRGWHVVGLRRRLSGGKQMRRILASLLSNIYSINAQLYNVN